MSNVYDVLFKKPAIYKWEMPKSLERLAQTLIESGRLRIDTDDTTNFVRYSDPYYDVFLIFSYRELFDPKLEIRTKNILYHNLSRKYPHKQIHQKIDTVLNSLRSRIEMNPQTTPINEARIARLLVQSIDPIVFHLIFSENTEVFISYSHTIGDMLDIQSWQSVGDSSGLQSNDYVESAVFVSSGGNPFSKQKETDEYFNPYDGFPAMARLMVIAGQELGHFSDIKRDKRGFKISRHSANISATKAKKRVREGRIKDIRNCAKLENLLNEYGLLEAVELERHVKFYKKQKRTGRLVNITNRKAKRATKILLKKCIKNNLKSLTILPEKKYQATQIKNMLLDMEFNLAPKADAYQRDDPQEEEAIACVEALARVPQQVNKWGHQNTRLFMNKLYQIYYLQVIPDCIKSYEKQTGKKYNFTIDKPPHFLKQLYYKFLAKFFKYQK